MSWSILEDYLESNISSLKYRGLEARGDCPLCGKTKEHFSIHIGNEVDGRGRNRHGRWICFSCGRHGDLWELVGEMEGMSPTKAKAWWIQRGKEVAPPPDIGRARQRLTALRNRGTDEYIDTALPLGFTRITKARPKMLAERGVSLETAVKYGLGYCDTGDAAGRVVFPIHCPLGRSWTARAVSSAAAIRYYGGDGAGRLLYGWDVAFRDGTPEILFVCEGPMDVLSLAGAGLPAVGLMSKTIDETRAALLRTRANRCVVLLDSDAQADALKVSAALNNANTVLLSSGDPGDASPSELIRAAKTTLTSVQATVLVQKARVSSRRHRYSVDSL